MAPVDWLLLVGVTLVGAAGFYCWLRPKTGFQMPSDGKAPLAFDDGKNIRQWRWRIIK